MSHEAANEWLRLSLRVLFSFSDGFRTFLTNLDEFLLTNYSSITLTASFYFAIMLICPCANA